MQQARLRTPTLLAGAAALMVAAATPGSTSSPGGGPEDQTVLAGASTDPASTDAASTDAASTDGAALAVGRAEMRDRPTPGRDAAREPTVTTAAASQPQPAAPPRAATVAGGTVWDRLAECESQGRWRYDGASGYDGGLQFHPRTWSAYSPSGYPAYAHQATRAQQIAVAERILDDQGWGAWPRCSRQLGLR